MDEIKRIGATEESIFKGGSLLTQFLSKYVGTMKSAFMKSLTVTFPTSNSPII